jgi:tRNA G10  N-methylase Trm11
MVKAIRLAPAQRKGDSTPPTARRVRYLARLALAAEHAVVKLPSVEDMKDEELTTLARKYNTALATIRSNENIINLQKKDLDKQDSEITSLEQSHYHLYKEGKHHAQAADQFYAEKAQLSAQVDALELQDLLQRGEIEAQRNKIDDLHHQAAIKGKKNPV